MPSGQIAYCPVRRKAGFPGAVSFLAYDTPATGSPMVELMASARPTSIVRPSQRQKNSRMVFLTEAGICTLFWSETCESIKIGEVPAKYPKYGADPVRPNDTRVQTTQCLSGVSFVVHLAASNTASVNLCPSVKFLWFRCLLCKASFSGTSTAATRRRNSCSGSRTGRWPAWRLWLRPARPDLVSDERWFQQGLRPYIVWYEVQSPRTQPAGRM